MYNESEIALIPHSNSIKPTLIESFRSLFYLIPPSESKFGDVSLVPDYTSAVRYIYTAQLKLYWCGTDL